MIVTMLLSCYVYASRLRNIFWLSIWDQFRNNKKPVKENNMENMEPV